MFGQDRIPDLTGSGSTRLRASQRPMLSRYSIMSMRVGPAEFRHLNLRCHTFLADVPLHDVWAIPLDGGGPGRTIRDAHAVLFGPRRQRATPAVRALFALRWALGRLFGWDDEQHDASERSYVHRLTDADRARSEVAPGSRDGPFRVLYAFANEAVAEIRNATVHGFMGLALLPRAGGYTLYMAVYVKPVSRLTPFYMALIEPFRRFIVYPALCRGAQRSWSRTYAAVPTKT
jgi:uncharacterized protein DUF2867